MRDEDVSLDSGLCEIRRGMIGLIENNESRDVHRKLIEIRGSRVDLKIKTCKHPRREQVEPSTFWSCGQLRDV